jgi:hypothetical protein
VRHHPFIRSPSVELPPRSKPSPTRTKTAPINNQAHRPSVSAVPNSAGTRPNRTGINSGTTKQRPIKPAGTGGLLQHKPASAGAVL